jgi:hypothetical protein
MINPLGVERRCATAIPCASRSTAEIRQDTIILPHYPVIRAFFALRLISFCRPFIRFPPDAWLKQQRLKQHSGCAF